MSGAPDLFHSIPLSGAPDLFREGGQRGLLQIQPAGDEPPGCALPHPHPPALGQWAGQPAPQAAHPEEAGQRRLQLCPGKCLRDEEGRVRGGAGGHVPVTAGGGVQRLQVKCLPVLFRFY